jgi:hypothetical protein
MAVGDLIRYRGKWITEAPTHCPNGHRLGPGRSLVGHAAYTESRPATTPRRADRPLRWGNPWHPPTAPRPELWNPLDAMHVAGWGLAGLGLGAW